MADRPKTPTYYVFFILFHPDAWRILFAFVFSMLLTPQVAPPDLATSGRMVLYMMLAAIGWAVSGIPARWITGALKKGFLGNPPKK